MEQQDIFSKFGYLVLGHGQITKPVPLYCHAQELRLNMKNNVRITQKCHLSNIDGNLSKGWGNVKCSLQRKWVEIISVHMSSVVACLCRNF